MKVRFSVSVPCVDPTSPRLRNTLESIYRQHVQEDSRFSIEIFVVTPFPEKVPAENGFLRNTRDIQTFVIGDAGKGLYSALAKSLPMHSGQIHSYIGAGDTYEPQAFTIVAEIGQRSEEYFWITGMVVARREDGAIVRATLPPRYSKRGLRRSIYGRLAPGLQQESTWWGTALHNTIPLHQLAQYEVAGDFFLWHRFSKFCEPIVVEAVLSSFTWHKDNMSGDWLKYSRELTTIAGSRVSMHDRLLSKILVAQWALPNRIKVKFSRGRVLRWQWPDGPWK